MEDAYVITIGNEILKGRTVNTNAAFIGNFLTLSGYRVRRSLVVMDDLDEIAWAFKLAMENASLVVSSGGLGPTFDDMTLEGFVRATGQKLVLDDSALSMIREKYGNIELTKERIKMATIPEGSEPVPNPVGTAPGIYYEKDEKKVIILPGVPSEMQAILETLKTRIRQKDVHYWDESVEVTGIMESAFAPVVASLMKKYPDVYIKSHPKNIDPLLRSFSDASFENFKAP
ncbi:MAG: nicotinamide mononucleotide deamidase-related protein, partial [Thermoplasmata archaeon]